jgi:hypothetical protein
MNKFHELLKLLKLLSFGDAESYNELKEVPVSEDVDVFFLKEIVDICDVSAEEV